MQIQRTCIAPLVRADGVWKYHQALEGTRIWLLFGGDQSFQFLLSLNLKHRQWRVTVTELRLK